MTAKEVRRTKTSDSTPVWKSMLESEARGGTEKDKVRAAIWLSRRSASWVREPGIHSQL